jgi:type IV secretion system protein VirB2
MIGDLIMQLNNIKLTSDVCWKLCIMFCLFASVLVFSVDPAFATTTTTTTTAKGDAISGVLCTIVNKFNGPLGKGIATLAIIVIGVGLFLGKLNWAVAVATAIGIGLIFGAGNMVSWISAAGGGTGGTGADCPVTTS